ncbi:MAG TPA: hypothetical protein VGB17_06395 [Pyrinomonadaceae bacterium]|jgi:hypothetical protein
MKTVTGIFNSRADADRALSNLSSIGIPDDRINLLTPGTTSEEVEASVPTTETEQPGMGQALGGTVGGAMGVAGGATLGAAAASLLVPGVGPVIAAGLLGAALFGAGGAAAGVTAGEALEDTVAPELPHDELYLYEDALRKGRTVIIAAADDDTQADAARNALFEAGAEGLDTARENWWTGLRDAEEEEYTRRQQGGDFKKDEPHYRRGFEAALHPRARGKSYEEAADYLRERHSDVYTGDAFRQGYQRGQSFQEGLREKYKA